MKCRATGERTNGARGMGLGLGGEGGGLRFVLSRLRAYRFLWRCLSDCDCAGGRAVRTVAEPVLMGFGAEPRQHAGGVSVSRLLNLGYCLWYDRRCRPWVSPSPWGGLLFVIGWIVSGAPALVTVDASRAERTNSLGSL